MGPSSHENGGEATGRALGDPAAEFITSPSTTAWRASVNRYAVICVQGSCRGRRQRRNGW